MIFGLKWEQKHGAFWNNWASRRRVAEIYARTVSNCADNVIATSRIANNTLFAISVHTKHLFSVRKTM
ncbi:MAG: hypothetical protein WCC17_01705 [Candidatus Nitrosopolaris sp.]